MFCTFYTLCTAKNPIRTTKIRRPIPTNSNCALILTLLMRRRMNENTVWTNSQDYRAKKSYTPLKIHHFAKQAYFQAKLQVFSGSHPYYFLLFHLGQSFPKSFCPKTHNSKICNHTIDFYNGSLNCASQAAASSLHASVDLPKRRIP